MNISVIATILRGKEGDGIERPCFAVDYAAVDPAAPFEKLLGLYHDLNDVLFQALVVFGSRLSAGEPFLVASLETTDGAPAGPILLSIPCNGVGPFHGDKPNPSIVSRPAVAAE